MNLLHSAALPGPLGTVLQTIVDTSGPGPELFAVECLTRGPRGTRLEQAPPLFDYVRRRGLETEMDCACVARAVRAAAGRAPRIAINVHPSTLGDKGKFVRYLLKQTELAGVDPSRLIIEVGEQAPAADKAAFCRELAALRKHGVAIAVDDVGFGHSNYKAILDCAPDFLKIDRYFIDGVSNDGRKLAVVRSIMDLAKHFGATVIAEGVEEQNDHDALRAAGIALFQGFLFSRPEAPPQGAPLRTFQARIEDARPPFMRWV